MTTLSKTRIESIDLLKGVVMVLMALDHTRDYFHQTFNLLDLTSPEHTYWSVYITRWVTHFCAPAFSFLAGVSAYLVGRRKTKTELSAFLLKRGIWLVLIEVTIVTFAWYLDVTFRNIDLAVIWSLGISMVLLAAIIHLPLNAILLFACVLIFGHNLLDGIHFEGNIWWSMLHESTFYQLSPNFSLNVFYPIVPWVGVMALGYYFGRFFNATWAPAQRKRFFNTIGLVAVLVFLLLRWSNVYGDLLQWQSYDTLSKSLFSFFNVTKYPPSLLFLLITLGGTFVFLANSEHWKGKLVDFFTVFGRVPFFYYILHLYLIRVLSLIGAELTGFGWEIMIQDTFEFNLKGFGFNLGIVYLIWVAIILMLYPLCKMFDRYKQGHKHIWWLSYL